MAALQRKDAREYIPRRIYFAVKGYLQAPLAIEIIRNADNRDLKLAEIWRK